MNRLLMAAALWAALTLAAGALTLEERFVAGLQAQGYVIVERGYTFLGRLRLVVENDTVYREIVVNPGTGEILRDYAVLLANKPGAAAGQTNGTAGALPDATPVATATVAEAPTTTATSTDAPDTHVEPTLLLGDPVLPLTPEVP